MNDTPTLVKIHNAVDHRIKHVRRSKLSLANTVRARCQEQPDNVPFEVGGHTLKWIEAECFAEGGRARLTTTRHTQMVLTLDDRLIDEPQVEVIQPGDLADNGWDTLYVGPINGWFHAGAWEAYENDGSNPDFKPRPMKTCKLAELKEVARTLPQAMAAWLAQKASDLEVAKTETPH